MKILPIGDRLTMFKRILKFIGYWVAIFLIGAGLCGFLHVDEMNAAFLVLFFGSLFLAILINDL
jgi:hypothetical protein